MKFPQWDQIATKISYEIFQKMLEKFPAEFLKMPDERFKVWIDVLKKILREVLLKLVEIPEETCQKILQITLNWYATGINVIDIIFKHCFHEDVFKGTVSSDERDFVVMMKNIHTLEEKTSAIDTFYIYCCEKMQKKNENS